MLPVSANGLKLSTWLRWGPALLMMAVIFASSSVPAQEIPTFGAIDVLVKKGGHMLGYALLAATYWWGLGDRRPRAALLALLMAAIYATSDEFHQHFVAGRGSEVSDVLIDSTGAAIGLAAIQLSRRLRNRA